MRWLTLPAGVAAEDGPVFTVCKLDQEDAVRQFNASRSHDVSTRAPHLLADLGT
jgi:hypothetical protein